MPASTDATLSALSLSGITLSPGFGADTLIYTGSVGNAVTSTTVTATANDDGATVAIVPADADATADDHQVTLDVGATAIAVTVTAEDGTTMTTYTVTVTRAAAVEVKSIEMRRYERLGEPYRIGDELLLVVEFSHHVACTSSAPSFVRFDIGTSRKNATYYTNSVELNTRWHRYIVEEGDLDTDGITIPAGPEALPEKYTKDSCTGPAFDETRIAAQGPLADHQVDGVRPRLVAGGAVTSADGRQILLTFSESLSAATAAAGAFAVTAVPVTAPGITGVSASGDTVTLGLDSAVGNGQTVTVTYTDPTSDDDATALQDVAGNDVETFTETIQNNSTVVLAAPGAPTGLGATAAGATRIDLAWTAPADNGGRAISGYRIEWSAAGADPWTELVADTGSTGTSYSDTGLAAGTTRHYRVAAINAVGAGAASAAASATTVTAASTGIELGLDPASVTEGGGVQTITVTASLDGAARTVATSVAVSRTGGTATSGTDYAAVSDFTITIPAASTSAMGTFSFAPTDDTVAEGAETVILTGSATGLSSGAATLTITDDDEPAITLTLDIEGLSGAVVQHAENSGTVPMVLRAETEAGAPRPQDFAVAYEAVDNTATAGTDYEAPDLTFAFDADDFVLENGRYVNSVSKDIGSSTTRSSRKCNISNCSSTATRSPATS